MIRKNEQESQDSLNQSSQANKNVAPNQGQASKVKPAQTGVGAAAGVDKAANADKGTSKINQPQRDREATDLTEESRKLRDKDGNFQNPSRTGKADYTGADVNRKGSSFQDEEEEDEEV